MAKTFKSKTLSNTPPAAEPDPKAVVQWYEAWGKSVVGRNRFFILSAFLAAAVVAMAVALAAITPLKTVQPYIVKVADTGQVFVDPAGTQAYEPGEAEKKYFLGKWVEYGWTIDSRFLTDYLEKAYNMTRDKAVAEFRELIEASRPAARLAENPSLTATPSISSINFIREDTALIRFHVTERTRMEKDTPIVTYYAMTTRFIIDPPKTEKEILENPIGLFIVNFSLSREVH